MSEYVVTTPVYPGRDWTLAHYRKGIESLSPPPEAVGIVTEPSFFERHFSDNSLYTLVASHPPFDLPPLERIAIARTALLDWYVTMRPEPFQLWVDSDIEVMPDTAYLLQQELKNHEAVIALNRYLSHNESGGLWYGLGCALIDRHVAGLGVFRITSIAEEKINEDLYYLGQIDGLKEQIRGAFKRRLKRSLNEVIIKTGISPVIHHIDNGSLWRVTGHGQGKV